MPGFKQTPVRRRVGVLRRFVWLAAAAALLAIGWPQLRAWEQGRFLEQLEQQALQSPEGAAKLAVRELAAQGLPATPSLVELATAQRAELAMAAQSAISDQLASWEIAYDVHHDVDELRERLQTLSKALQVHAASFGGGGQLWSQKLARRMASHCDRLQAQDAWEIIANCDHVLAIPRSQQRPKPPDDIRLEPKVARFNPVAEANLRRPTSTPAKPLTSAAEPAGRPAAKITLVEPVSDPLPTDVSLPAEATAKGAAANPLRADQLSLGSEALPPPKTRSPANDPAPAQLVDVPSPQELRHLVHTLRDLSDRKLVERVDAAERFESLAARRVLRERGFTDTIVDLARRLDQLPATERRDAIDRAATLPAAEARRLLRWFISDADAEVRMQALTLLATTGDPQLEEIARRQAIEDADPRVAELAAKLVKQK